MPYGYTLLTLICYYYGYGVYGMTFICWGWYQRPLPAPCVGLASFPASEGSRFPVLHRGRVLWASTGLLQRPSIVTGKIHTRKASPSLLPLLLRPAWVLGLPAILSRLWTVAGHRLQRSCCRGAVLLLSVILSACRSTQAGLPLLRPGHGP